MSQVYYNPKRNKLCLVHKSWLDGVIVEINNDYTCFPSRFNYFSLAYAKKFILKNYTRIGEL